ncbi:MAG: UDPGP type 1 family protein [Phycisphaerales bacterium]|nr:UDPGP type 1 family protein [Phycisphaerales bacterium]
MEQIIRKRLEAVGQAHLLTFIDELTPDAKERLLQQIDGIDLDSIETLIGTYVRGYPTCDVPSDVEPAPYYPYDPTATVRPYDAEQYRTQGEALVAAGKIAAFTVAGGQGSRLGFDGPKGAFPGGPVTGKPLFQLFSEGIAATQRKHDCTIPWYIMTSPLNDEETKRFFDAHDHFGLDRNNVMFFAQGVMPSFDIKTARLLLAAKDSVATNPDGHGGSLRAIFNSGALDDMTARGIEHISYTQVDNPLGRMIDPLFIGLHAGAPDSSAQMSSKMIPKVGPTERMGNFCVVDGKTTVIEYSDLPEELAHQRLPNGRLRFLAGSVAIHIISVEFIRRLNTRQAGPGGFSLPLHRADKKAPYIDLDTGKLVTPDEPNAVKLEAFVFDALPLCDKSIVYETDRTEEFAPIKNGSGVDSVQTAAQIQSNRNGAWLKACGVAIPHRDNGDVDAVIEISPLTALEASDLRNTQLPSKIKRGATIAL